jgi:hypothetical protein
LILPWLGFREEAGAGKAIREAIKRAGQRPERAGIVAWSSSRWYALGEAGVVKMNDWPMKVKRVGAGSVDAHPSKPAKGAAPTLW